MIDEKSTFFIVLPREYLYCNLEEVRIEKSIIVSCEYSRYLSSAHVITFSIDLIGLSDHLHDSILDTIMHHLHEVSGSIRADMRDTGSSREISSRDSCEKRFEYSVLIPTTSWHDGRTIKSSLFSTRYSTSDKGNSPYPQR
jgi:hypothetical protein